MKRVTFTALFVLVSLIGAELLCDLYYLAGDLKDAVRPPYPKKPVTLKSMYVPWFFQPGQTNRIMTQSKTVLSVNEYGFRGPPIDTNRPLVACLGDSVTFGWFASDDRHTYPFLLGSLLSDKGYGVVNAGMPGWNSADILDYYIIRVAPLKPRMTVILCGWNDVRHEMMAPYARQPMDIPFTRSMVEHFSLYRALAGVGRLMKHISMLHKPYVEPTHVTDHVPMQIMTEYELFLTALVECVRTREAGIPVLVTLPNFFNHPLSDEEKGKMKFEMASHPDYSYDGWRLSIDEINHRIRTVAKKSDTLLVEGSSVSDSSLFVDASHLTDSGNEQLAKLIAAQITPALPR